VRGHARMQMYVRSESVVSRLIAGETLIIPVRKGVGDLASIYSLNAVATVIWQSVSGPRSVEEIAHALEAEFAGERDRIERDLDTFLKEMNSAGLINEVEVAA
jgi:hypothetical protein